MIYKTQNQEILVINLSLPVKMSDWPHTFLSPLPLETALKLTVKVKYYTLKDKENKKENKGELVTSVTCRNSHCKTVYNSQDMEATYIPTDRGIKKIWYTYTMKYYSATKKNERMPFATIWMDRESVILSKSDRGEILYDFSYMWNLKRNDTNEFTYKTQRDLQTKKINLWLPGWGIVREFGKVMYMLLYSKWLTNKDLLYRHATLLNALCQPGREGDLGENG